MHQECGRQVAGHPLQPRDVARVGARPRQVDEGDRGLGTLHADKLIDGGQVVGRDGLVAGLHHVGEVVPDHHVGVRVDPEHLQQPLQLLLLACDVGIRGTDAHKHSNPADSKYQHLKSHYNHYARLTCGTATWPPC